MNITVIGAGSWGTAVASICATNGNVRLWARDEELAAHINTHHENDRYLAGVSLPKHIVATSVLQDALGDADVVIMGVPSHGFRAVLSEIRPLVNSSIPIISLSKGVEQGTLMRMTEVIADVLPDHDTAKIGVLTGPNLAREVAEGQPAASVIALRATGTAARLQQAFMTDVFRVYTNPDVVGCEIAGALKNVIALGAGIAHGLGFGDNAKSAIITRGLAELARLGVKLGGNSLTFSGLAGMGDLVATCTSEKSRNRTVGVLLGQGRSLESIVAEMNMVAEGVKSTEAVLALASQHGIEMPIAEMVGRVLYEGQAPAVAVATLMQRDAKPELLGMR